MGATLSTFAASQAQIKSYVRTGWPLAPSNCPGLSSAQINALSGRDRSPNYTPYSRMSPALYPNSAHSGSFYSNQIVSTFAAYFRVFFNQELLYCFQERTSEVP